MATSHGAPFWVLGAGPASSASELEARELVGDRLEVALHGGGESVLVVRGLDHRGLRMARNGAHGLGHGLHFLDEVVLAQIVDDADHLCI